MDEREALNDAVKRLMAACEGLEDGLPDRVVVHTTRRGEHPVQIVLRDLQYPAAYLATYEVPAEV